MAATHFSGPVVSLNGFVAGNGTQITKVTKGTIAVDLASVDTMEVTEITLTIAGAAVGDSVIMNPVAAGNSAGLIFGGARVSAADTVKMRIFNGSSGTVNESSQIWDYCLIRS